MNYRKYKKYIIKNLSNIPGWSSQKKIVVFESDDWGSLRMPSSSVFKKLENAGLDLRSADAERFNINDNLASSNDLESLFEVLSGVKDVNGNFAVFTPVTIVANPDFQKIKDSDYMEYFYEPFTKTLKRFNGCENAFNLWIEGVDKRLFVPQMHGREHLNVFTWLKSLRKGDVKTLAAFEEGVWGFVPDSYPEVDYQAAFLLSDPVELTYHKGIIEKGLKLFKDIFGYSADYFVPPNGRFNNSLNKVLIDNGIKIRSVSKQQVETLDNGKQRKGFHYLGQWDKNGIRYITRNCLFEPSQVGRDWVNSCLYDIQVAFRWNKPAIVSTHRVNFIGSLNPKNKDIGLRNLSDLLKAILKKWPDVEFMTTAELGALMNTDHRNE